MIVHFLGANVRDGMEVEGDGRKVAFSLFFTPTGRTVPKPLQITVKIPPRVRTKNA